MLIQPKKRKVLKYKKMKELELSTDKVQVLFILNKSTIPIYNDLLQNFENEQVEVNIVTDFEFFYKEKHRFNYFNISELDYLFEVCEVSYFISDERKFIYDLQIVQDISELNCIKNEEVKVQEDEVSIILSHANTPEKIEVLIECIESLKIKGQKIILASHIKVDDDILNSVDYFVYDKKNRLIGPDEFDGNARTWAYHSYKGYYHEWNYSNHALAVLDLMKCSIGVAIANNYRVAHMIHYDCILYDRKLLKKHYDKLNDFDIYHYYYYGYEDRMDGNFFSVVTDKFLREIFRINKKEDFVQYGLAIFEAFLKKLFYNTDLKIDSAHIENLFYKNIIDKVKMVTLHFEKEYENGLISHTYILASKKEDDKYILITTSDYNINYAFINNERFSILPDEANIFKIDDRLLENKIYVDIPQVGYKQIIDNEVEYANCIHLIPELTNFIDLTI
jgi:hypothetical protein